jgi:hypothetical protein
MRIFALSILLFALIAAHADPPATVPVPAPDKAEPSKAAGLGTAPPPPTNVPLVPAGTGFLDAFPKLRNYLFEEPNSGFFLGFGFSPVGLLGNQFMFTGNFFEVHWIHGNYDLELFDASYSATRGQSSEFQSTHFTFKTVPKYRIFGPISVGPLVGYESVSFPGVGVRILRSGFIEPNSEPLSMAGWIFGAAVSQTFNYAKGYLLKFNESIYQETYNSRGMINGWNYYFDDQALQTNRGSISAGTVLMFDASLLY